MARLAALEQTFAETLQDEKLAALGRVRRRGRPRDQQSLDRDRRPVATLSPRRDRPRAPPALALINAQAMRVHEMIADLRLFARPPQPELQPVELVQLIDRLIAELTAQTPHAGIVVCREGDPGPLTIMADPTQLLVALRALCQNSIEALGARRPHRHRSSSRRAGVEICVADDGPGIPAEERKHLFDPFFSARQAGRGLGLGLSKCWRIVSNHGGRIQVESSPGQGAAFTITLPAD